MTGGQSDHTAQKGCGSVRRGGHVSDPTRRSYYGGPNRGAVPVETRVWLLVPTKNLIPDVGTDGLSLGAETQHVLGRAGTDCCGPAGRVRWTGWRTERRFTEKGSGRHSGLPHGRFTAEGIFRFGVRRRGDTRDEDRRREAEGRPCLPQVGARPGAAGTVWLRPSGCGLSDNTRSRNAASVGGAAR